MSISCIADVYLSYYSELGAEVQKSAPLIHPLFPRSFNMSAGLVQLERELRSVKKIAKQKRVVVQKCFRHYDIDRVAKNSHLSFFEMGGYFEIGEIDRTSLINNLYSLLVNIYRIDPNKLWVTTFAGGDYEGYPLPRDSEVYERWRQLLPNPEHLVELGVDDNYWVQGGGTIVAGTSKLCGPQTEVFYEMKTAPCAKGELCMPNCECGRFMEISNNLLITHKINSELQITKLLNPAIESVVGIERLCAVVEGKSSVFGTADLDYRDGFGFEGTEDSYRAARIIDHLRALYFIVPELKLKQVRNSRTRILRGVVRELLTDIYMLDFETKTIVEKVIAKIARQYEGRYPTSQQNIESVLGYLYSQEKDYLQVLEKARVAIQAYMDRYKLTELDQSLYENFWMRYGIPVELQTKYFG